MPETLTPASSFDTNVEVPLGTENTRAAHLKAFVQKLLNRSEWLNVHASKLDAANTFTAANTFSGSVAVNDTLTVRPDAATAVGVKLNRASSPSSWNNLLEFETAGGALVRLYTGPDGVNVGSFALVYNAAWNGTQWSLEDTSKKAVALIVRYDNVRLVGKPAGSAAWSAWPQSTLTAFGSTILSEILQAARVLANANTDADNTNGYRYPSAVDRLSPIPLGSLWGNILINSAGHIQRNVGVSTEYDQIWIPIRIPMYCSFKQVKVHFQQLQSGDSSHPDQFQLMRRQGYQAWEAVGSVETHNVFGDTVALLHTSGAQQVTEQYEWAYRWRVVSSDLAASLNRIMGIELEWVDVGPNNRVG